MSKDDQPWEIDSRLLHAFTAIARTKSVSRAAEELNYVQSAVSQQLAALERLVGHRLLDRGSGPRPVTLTAAGSALLPHALWILDRLETARSELKSLESGLGGSLRIGTFQSAGARLMPRVLAAYRERWPSISVSIYNEVEDGELNELVLSGALDVAFVEDLADVEGLVGLELMKDSFVVLVPPGHRLATRTSVTIADLDGEDMVTGGASDRCTAKVQAAMRSADVQTRVVFRTVDNPTRQRMVDVGLGCAVQPDLTVEPGLENGAIVVPLDDGLFRTISLSWARERTPSFALTSFVEVTKSVLDQLQRPRSNSATAQPSGVDRGPGSTLSPATALDSAEVAK